MTITHGRTDGARLGRVAVVGARGFVGAAAAASLLERGASVEAVSSSDVDLLAPGAADALSSRLAGCESAVLVSAIAPARDIATVIADLIMAGAFADAVEAAGVPHVVAVSSDAVFGDHQTVIGADEIPAPTSMHGAMHATRELALAQRFGRLCVLRPTLLYGEHDPHNGYGPNRFLRLAAEHDTITLFGDGEEQRDHMHVGDLAAVIAAVCTRQSVGSMCVATGTSVSFRAAAELCVALMSSRSTIEGTSRQNPITHRHFDVADRLVAFPDLTIEPLEAGLRRVVERREHA